MELNEEFDPRRHHTLTVAGEELTDAERNTRAGPIALEDIDLNLARTDELWSST